MPSVCLRSPTPCPWGRLRGYILPVPRPRQGITDSTRSPPQKIPKNITSPHHCRKLPGTLSCSCIPHSSAPRPPRHGPHREPAATPDCSPPMLDLRVPLCLAWAITGWSWSLAFSPYDFSPPEGASLARCWPPLVSSASLS